MKLRTSAIAVIIMLLPFGWINAQNNTFSLTIDPIAFSPITLDAFPADFCRITHNPTDEDRQRYAHYRALTMQKPTRANYELYHSLACSLWELGKIKEAEKMFLGIADSRDSFYSNSYNSASDVPGDTTTNDYGYGSYTFNYKNSASIYLAQIYIEQKQFTKALGHLENATKKYRTVYNCGTGAKWQAEKYNCLYAFCYQGLNQYRAIVDLLLPGHLDASSDILVNAIRQLYSKSEIEQMLSTSEQNFELTIDSVAYYVREKTMSDNPGENENTANYFGAKAKFQLFGHQVEVSLFDYQNYQTPTREWVINWFRKSFLFTQLKNPSKSERLVSH